MLVADHNIIDVGSFVREVVEPALVAADAEEGVVVDIIVAAVEPIERADDIGLLARIELVGATEAEHLAIPAERLLEILAHNDKMAEPLDVRRARLDAEQFALAAVFVLPGIDRRPLDRNRLEHLHAIDDFDLVSVGVGQANALAAAGLVDLFDRRGAVDARDLIEILHAGSVNGDADIAWLTQFGDMDVM